MIAVSAANSASTTVSSVYKPQTASQSVRSSATTASSSVDQNVSSICDYNFDYLLLTLSL